MRAMEDHPEKQDTQFPQPRINEVAQKFLADLDEERKRLLASEFPLCAMLIDEAVDRIFSTGRIPGKEFQADVFRQKPMKITQKIFIPVKQYPQFNFTGKILGPKGNSLRRLQEETQCKIVIKGRNSMRDRVKEEELRSSNDLRFSHLNKDLFLEVSTVATPAECYARIAYALAEIRKYLIPDRYDEVSHEQLRELIEIDPEGAKNIYGKNFEQYRSVFDEKFGAGPSGHKFLNLLKNTADANNVAEQQEMDQYEYSNRYQKHGGGGGAGGGAPNGYENGRARQPFVPPNSIPYKRQQTPSHPTEVKRMREGPGKPYYKQQQPQSYSILNKYK